MPIENVSFIVIARNEQFGLEKCLSSIASSDLRGCEVICVDSGSSDGTVAVMRGFGGRIANLQVVTLKGYSNAAVARNVGLRRATRNVIYFLDGDVEINPAFVTAGVERVSNGAGAVTGKLRELQYTRDFSDVIKDIPDRFHIQGEERIFASGGCFLASRRAVLNTGFFDERLERSQDYDFTLRLSRRFTMLAIPISMGTHHTIGYEDRSRLLIHIKRLHALFFGMALRRNLANLRGILWLLSQKERGIALGGILSVACLSAVAAYGAAGAAIAAALVAVDLAIGMRRGDDCLYRSYLHYLFPVLALAGCLSIPNRCHSYIIEEVLT